MKKIIGKYPLTVFILVSLDQILKIVVKNYFMDSEFDIIKNILSIQPSFIRAHSWLNSLFDLKIGMTVYVICIIIVLVVSFFIYGFLKKKKADNLPIELMFLFFYSGTICSLIDKIFWRGSLDYIFLKGFFIFDLKDVYLSLFEISLIVGVIINFKDLNKFQFKGFWKYVLDRFGN